MLRRYPIAFLIALAATATGTWFQRSYAQAWSATCTAAPRTVPCHACGTTAELAQLLCFRRCNSDHPRLTNLVNSNCTPEGGSGTHPGTHPEFVRTQPFSKGCIHIWWHQIYFDPGCQNPAGGGAGEVLAYRGEWTNVISLVIVNDCVITAFTDQSIWKSCDGHNLAGGGHSVKLYPPETLRFRATVSEMIPCREGGLRVMFKTGDCYMTPSGEYPAGGGDSRHCAPTDTCTRP